LTNYAQGSFVLNYFKKHNVLSCRNVLVEIIVNDLIKRESQMTLRLDNSVADDSMIATGTFPTEIKVGIYIILFHLRVYKIDVI